jgi:hypothetical protein
VFAGLAEAIGGVLLLWRRTAMLGALLVIAVMTNVVMLNFCYDVPVKLYSMQLLMMAGLIALPGARRMIAAAMGYAVADLPPRLRMSRWRERVRILARFALIAVLAVGIYQTFSSQENRNARVHELNGTWTVDSFLADGVELPPLVGDPVRWQTWIASARYTSMWLMTGQRDAEASENHGSYPLEVDAANHTIAVMIDEQRKTREIWKYSQPTPDLLVIDGVHSGKLLHVTLHRAPDGLLMTRGFHWINEVPFNR